jgi:hypothetical protein
MSRNLTFVSFLCRSCLQVPSVVDGIIPVNSHGNVEVWDFNEALVPLGGRLVPHRAALRVAESLGLPAAPALVG